MKTPIPPPVNFIVASLCDNDFGHVLRKGLLEGVEEYGYQDKLCPLLWKKFLIAYVIGQQLKSQVSVFEKEYSIDFKYAKNVENYLQARLRVTFERRRPEEDHDHGSACIDVRTGAAWTY